jgi:hypothetical protein
MIIGLLRTIRKFRIEYRLLLIALLAAPAGARFAWVSQRASHGHSHCCSDDYWLTCAGICWKAAYQKPVFPCLICVLSLFNFSMMRDALVNDPTWYTDYSGRHAVHSSDYSLKC